MDGGWIAVASADHVAEAVRRGVFLCSHGSGTAAARPMRGDRFAYYAPRARMGEGEPVQAFVALGTIVDETAETREIGGFTAGVRRADYAATGTAPVRPLLPRLGFVRDPKHWGMAVRRGLFAVDAADFAVIEEALGHG